MPFEFWRHRLQMAFVALRCAHLCPDPNDKTEHAVEFLTSEAH